jgi:hypothetical protein
VCTAAASIHVWSKSTTTDGLVGNFTPNTETGSMVTYSSMPGKRMFTPVVVAGSPELGPVTEGHCSNVAKGVPITPSSREL